MAESVADIGDGETPPPLSLPRRGEGDPTDAVGTGPKIERGRWDDIRADFESDTLTEAGICDKHKVLRDELWLHARRGK